MKSKNEYTEKIKSEIQDLHCAMANDVIADVNKWLKARKEYHPVDQMFRVPNNDEGRAFIANLKKYSTPDITVRVRGRTPNEEKCRALGRTKGDYWGGTTIEVADNLGIYLQVPSDDYSGKSNLGASTIHRLRKTVKRQVGDDNENIKRAVDKAEKVAEERIQRHKEVVCILEEEIKEGKAKNISLRDTANELDRQLKQYQDMVARYDTALREVHDITTRLTITLP